jgi:hypothetical protein
MRLRFTIRDLLWLATLVSVCVAWWISNRQMADRIERLQRTPPAVSLSDPAVERAMQFDSIAVPGED